MNGLAGLQGMGSTRAAPPPSGPGFHNVAEETMKMAICLTQGILALRERLGLVLRPGVQEGAARAESPAMCQAHGALQGIQAQLRDGQIALQEIADRLWL